MRFPGLSCICGADGVVLERLDGREGIVVADVSLDPGRRRQPEIPPGYWSHAPRTRPRSTGALFRILEAAGKVAYAWSRKRRRAARHVTLS